MQIMLWIAIGLVSGWATGRVLKESGYGILTHVVIGIAGALSGGLLTRRLEFAASDAASFTFVVAISGAILLQGIAGLGPRRKAVSAAHQKRES